MRRFLFAQSALPLRSFFRVTDFDREPVAKQLLIDYSLVRFVKATSVLLALLFALPAVAQKEIVTITDWRVHAGDNPAWARPNFDDSTWARIEYSQLYSSGLETGTRWYRATLQVAGLAAKRAAEIAEEAHWWGQGDDITVPTVTRAANMEAAIA